MANAIQQLRAKQIIKAVGHYGHHKGWPWPRTRRCMLLALTCAADESNWFVYANRYNIDSQHAEHDALGQDHDSVGLFQQRVPMWGTTEACMNPYTSAQKFLNALDARGLTEFDKPGWSLGERIQAVQVSAPGETDFDGDGRMDGRNYQAQVGRAWRFLFRHMLLARQAWHGDALTRIPAYPNK